MLRLLASFIGTFTALAPNEGTARMPCWRTTAAPSQRSPRMRGLQVRHSRQPARSTAPSQRSPRMRGLQVAGQVRGRKARGPSQRSPRMRGLQDCKLGPTAPCHAPSQRSPPNEGTASPPARSHLSPSVGRPFTALAPNEGTAELIRPRSAPANCEILHSARPE